MCSVGEKKNVRVSEYSIGRMTEYSSITRCHPYSKGMEKDKYYASTKKTVLIENPFKRYTFLLFDQY